ncbi:MAG: hypothetical protein ACREKI_06125 [Gemmatimonadota bacterium]
MDATKPDFRAGLPVNPIHVLGVAILGMLVSMEMGGLPVTWGVAGLSGGSTILSVGLPLRFLSGVRAEASLFQVLESR